MITQLIKNIDQNREFNNLNEQEVRAAIIELLEIFITAEPNEKEITTLETQFKDVCKNPDDLNVLVEQLIKGAWICK